MWLCSACAAELKLLSVSSFVQNTDELYIRLAFSDTVPEDRVELARSYRTAYINMSGVSTALQMGVVTDPETPKTSLNAFPWGLKLTVDIAGDEEYSMSYMNSLVLLKLKKPRAVDYDAQAKTMLDQALLTPDAAIFNLRQIQMLPTNKYQVQAQKLLIDLLIQQNEFERAKAELRLYLDMWPNALDVTQQRQRLIALEIAQPAPVSNRAMKPREWNERSFEYSGSTSVYNVRGATQGHADQNVGILSSAATTVSNWDEFKVKTQFRTTRVEDYIHPSGSSTKVSAANIEAEDRVRDLYIKAGRQNPISGILGRFDGIIGRAAVSDHDRLWLSTGVPWSGPGSYSKRQFYGAAVEHQFDNPASITGYVNVQTADGITERQAVGIEARAIMGGSVITGTVEYDAVYKAVNAVSIQPKIDLGDGVDLHMYYDQRKYPVLYGDRALMLGFNRPEAMAYRTVGEAFAQSGLSSSEMYHFVDKATPTGIIEVVGLSKAFNSNWSVYGDLQRTNVSSARDPTFVPSELIPESRVDTAGSGTTTIKNLNINSNNLWSKTDQTAIILSRTDDTRGSSNAVTGMVSQGVGDFRVDLTARYYTRSENTTAHTEVLTQVVRASYKMNKSVNTEIQFNTTSTKNDVGSTANQFVVIGVRADF